MTTEYEVVCCYETEYGAGISNSFKTIEEAMEEFKRFTNLDKEDQYYIVYLNKTLRTIKYGNPDSSEEIKVWRREEEKMTTQSKTLDCYNCEKKCDEEKMPYSKVWIGKVCDECYEEEEEEKEFIGEYEVKCFEYDNESSWTEDYKDDYECALERFNWITDRGGLYRNEYTGKATYCDKVILCEKEYGGDEEMELKVWEKDEKLPQGNSAKKEEQKKLILENVGSKEEKMTEEQVFSFLNPTDPELICSKCPLPLTEDDMAMFDGTICESCLEEKEEEKEVVEDNAFTIMLKIKEDYSLALAWATGIRSGYDIAMDGYGDDDAMVDFWKTLLNTHFIKDEWKVKIFTEFYDDYVIFNGEILEEEEFKDQYPKMVDKEGNKIRKHKNGEYITQKKKIKLNIVKK